MVRTREIKGSVFATNAFYGKNSKTLNTFQFLFENKMLLIRTGIHNRLVRIANKEDPDQTASCKAV